MNDDTRIIDAVRRCVQELVIDLDLRAFVRQPFERRRAQ